MAVACYLVWFVMCFVHTAVDRRDPDGAKGEVRAGFLLSLHDGVCLQNSFLSEREGDSHSALVFPTDLNKFLRSF